jgi:hypothetical protein
MRRQVASARRSSGARHSEAFLFGRASAVVVIAGTRPSERRTPLFLSSSKAPFRFRCETSNFITHRNTGWIFIGSWEETRKLITTATSDRRCIESGIHAPDRAEKNSPRLQGPANSATVPVSTGHIHR